VESFIRSFDASLGEFAPHWVNSDGSSPATYMLMSQSTNALHITGDIAAFENNFGWGYTQVTGSLVYLLSIGSRLIFTNQNIFLASSLPRSSSHCLAVG
jgi:hypothetical protein